MNNKTSQLFSYNSSRLTSLAALLMLVCGILFAGCGVEDIAQQSQQGTPMAGMEIAESNTNGSEISLEVTTSTTIHPGDIEDELTLIPNDQLTSRAKEGLALLENRLEQAGVSVLSVSTRVASKSDLDTVRISTRETDELPVAVVRVTKDYLHNNDFSNLEIERQAIAAVWSGAPIAFYYTVAVDETTGEERTWQGCYIRDYIGGYWLEPNRLEYSKAEAAFKAAIEEVCKKEELLLNEYIFSEDNIGRVADIKVTFAGDSMNSGSFLDNMQRSIGELNIRDDAKLSLVRIYINDKNGLTLVKASFTSAGDTFWLYPDPKYWENMDMWPDSFTRTNVDPQFTNQINNSNN